MPEFAASSARLLKPYLGRYRRSMDIRPIVLVAGRISDRNEVGFSNGALRNPGNGVRAERVRANFTCVVE